MRRDKDIIGYKYNDDEQKLREQIAKDIEAMECEENMHHTRRETIIVQAYWKEAKLWAARIARGQK